MRTFARRLAAKQAKTTKGRNQTAFGLCEALRPRLTTLTGDAGFRSLLGRALTLASREHPWLSTVHLDPDGPLQGRGSMDAKIGANAIAEGEILLLAEVLGLLVAFIGEALTLRLVAETWPELTLRDMDFSRRSEK